MSLTSERVLSSRNKGGLLHNIATLYGVQLCTYILPLITVPYLTRKLGVAGWGAAAFYQALAQYFALMIEYGFNLSASREIAKNHDDRSKLGEIFAGVLGAKTTLAGTAFVCFVVLMLIPRFSGDYVLALGAVAFAIGQGMSTSWYFLGLERVWVVSVLDLFSRVVSTAVIFLTVRGRGDASMVLWAPAATLLCSAVASHILAWRELPFVRPTWRLTAAALRDGFGIFCQRGSSSLYMAVNAFLLGLFCTKTTVGYYAGPERLIRAFIQLASPIQQAVYPRVNRLLSKNQDEASRLSRHVSIAMTAAMGIMSLVLFALAPTIVKLVFGPQFQPSVGVLRALSAVLPLSAFGASLATFYLLPRSLDLPMVKVLFGAGIANVLVVCCLSGSLLQYAPVLGIVLAHVIVLIGFLRLSRKQERAVTAVSIPLGSALGETE